MIRCEKARELLPLALSGDLANFDAAALSEHLAGCPGCRRERAALEAARRALDSAETPAVAVDVRAIFAESAERQQRQLRRWRRFAAAGLALAASLLLFTLLRVDIEVNNGQFVVRWGERPQPAPPVVPQPGKELSEAIARATAASVELEERIKVLGGLVSALREDVATRDRQRQTEIAVLVGRLELMRDREQRRWEENRRDLTALYTAQFGQSN